MKAKAQVILQECIENGIKLGYHRAHKYNESPTEETVSEFIEEAIMGKIYEYFSFDEDDL